MQSCMQKNEKKNMKNGTVEAKLAWVRVNVISKFHHFVVMYYGFKV